MLSLLAPCAALCAASIASPLPLGDAASEPKPEIAAAPAIEIGGVSFRRVEVQASTFTASAQEFTAIAQDPALRTLAVWQSRRQEAGTYGIYAQRFDASGLRVGEEVHVNQYTDGPQVWPSVAVDASGAAWFAWESFLQDGDLGGIVARRFDAELATATPEVIVNDATAGHQTEPALACDAHGNAVIAWTGPTEDPAARAVFVRRLGADGKPLGAAVRADSGEAARCSLPTIALLGDGGFVVAWSRANADGTPVAVRARSFGADGAPQGGELALFEEAGRQPVEPVLAANASGELACGFLVASGADYVPHVRRFARGDEPGAWDGGAVIALASDGRGYTTGLDLDLAADGRLAVLWNSVSTDESKGDLYLRWIERDGTLGAPVPVTAAQVGHQRARIGGGASRLAVAAGGRIAVGWHGDAGLGDKNAANLTLLVPAEQESRTLAAASTLPPSPRFQELESGAGPHEPPVFDPRGARAREDLGSLESLGGPDFGFVATVQTSLTPPDPHCAVGPNHVVQMVNDTIAFFTKSGTPTFSQTFQGSSGNDFFQSVGSNGFSFDPEVLYDDQSGRFMAMCCERGSPSGAFFDFAVSDDSDPNGVWFKYRFNVTAAAGNDSGIDSPNMGVDNTAVYLSADFFGGNTKFLIFCVEKAAVLTGAVPTTRSMLITGTQSYGCAPVMYNNVSPAFYFIENLEAVSNNQLRIHAIRNPLTAPTDTIFSLSVPIYTPPEDPPQAGTSTRPEAFESRFWSCAYNNGRLWGAQHTGNPVRARWYEIDLGNWPTSGTPTLVQTGDIIPAAGVRTSFVSIGVDDQNNMACVFARSSPSEFFSMGRTFRLVGDPLGTTTPSVTMQSSSGPDFSGRWGDYSACVPDPGNSKIWWGTHEFNAGFWATWVGVFGPCDAPTVYCTAKVTSAGLTPVIGWQNEPALGANNFSLTMSNGLPGNSVIYFYGPGAQSVPFFNGILCVSPPQIRSGITNFDGSGSVSIPFPVELDDLGTDVFAQFWFRDPAQPDGTNIGLSDAVQFRICP